MYPLANMEVHLGGVVFMVEATMSNRLPMSVLLGTDMPQWVKLLIGVGREHGEQLWWQGNGCAGDDEILVSIPGAGGGRAARVTADTVETVEPLKDYLWHICNSIDH